MEDFQLANELPDLKIILAHAGALYALDHPLPSNIYLDLAACPLLYQPEIYQQLIERIEPKNSGHRLSLKNLSFAKTKPDFSFFPDSI